jgi:polyhydroxyalkanoate synthesis repressor PhaR
MGNAPGRVKLKKYANRRLYDTEKSAYITLNDVVEMVKQGRWVEVTDVDTGEDVTAFTLTQIIMEEAKKKNVLLPVPLLHLIIQYGETVLADFFGNYLEKMIKSYLTVKNIADEQFDKWLDVGAAINQGKNSAFPTENPFQSFFKQFFSTPKPSDEKDDKKNSRE